jgi:hypothetical protein
MGLNGFSVYGNNRKRINQSQLQEYLREALPVSDNDDAVFNEMASSFRPKLIGLLKRDSDYVKEVFQKTGYSNEVSFEEFFIWWYHFIYTRATNTLAEKKVISIPEQGNFFYTRSSSPPVQSSNPGLKIKRQRRVIMGEDEMGSIPELARRCLSGCG